MIKNTLKIKKGDKITVLSGKDKGKIGKVISVNREKRKVIVEGVNLLVKHTKARKQGEKGQRIQFPSPLNISNVKFNCPKCKKDVRVSWKILEDGKKVRHCNKCKQTFV